MLDYKKLDNEFTVLLNQFDEDRLEQWIAFDQKRLEMERLLNGDIVPIQNAYVGISYLSDPREIINSTGESNYSLAA